MKHIMYENYFDDKIESKDLETMINEGSFKINSEQKMVELKKFIRSIEGEDSDFQRELFLEGVLFIVLIINEHVDSYLQVLRDLTSFKQLSGIEELRKELKILDDYYYLFNENQKKMYSWGKWIIENPVPQEIVSQPISQKEDECSNENLTSNIIVIIIQNHITRSDPIIECYSFQELKARLNRLPREKVLKSVELTVASYRQLVNVVNEKLNTYTCDILRGFPPNNNMSIRPIKRISFLESDRKQFLIPPITSNYKTYFGKEDRFEKLAPKKNYHKNKPF